MSRNHTKVVTRHIWSEYMEYAEEYRHVFQYKEIYKQRRETIERVFADAKERHGLRYTMLRGLEKVKMQATLTFACMNLKKLAIWKHRKRQPKPPVHGKNSFCEKIKYRLLYKAKIWQRVWITRCHICLRSETPHYHSLIVRSLFYHFSFFPKLNASFNFGLPLMSPTLNTPPQSTLPLSVQPRCFIRRSYQYRVSS